MRALLFRLYPSVACYRYPVGPVDIIVHPRELAKLHFDEEGQAYFLDDDGDEDGVKRRRDVLGLLQCKILCPQTLLHPFLSVRIEQKVGEGGSKAEKSISPICTACAQAMSCEPCEHSVEERALVDTWTLSEIGYAVRKLGYTLIKSYECYAYTAGEYVFRDFLQPFARSLT